ncbi:MAG: hypothetical protein ABIX00_01540 [Polaromonas sp.]
MGAVSGWLGFRLARYLSAEVHQHSSNAPDCPVCFDEMLRLRHHSLLAPRDFDVSPYFAVIKPTLDAGFDFHALIWSSIDGPENLSPRNTSQTTSKAQETLNGKESFKFCVTGDAWTWLSRVEACCVLEPAS